MYKYNEFTPEQFAHCSRYGGSFTYLAELPHGTEFRVENGMWKGKVLHKEGKTFVQTTLSDHLCVNGENQLEINDRYYAWITLLKEGVPS